MKTAIIGSRAFADYALLKEKLDAIENMSSVISGGAKGADSLAERFATEKGLETLIILPDWKTYGKAAGVRRNELIVKEADLVVAFWDGKSAGTKNTIELAKKAKKKIKLYRIDR